MENDIDDDSEEGDGEHEQKKDNKKSDTKKLPTEATTTPHDSPSIGSNNKKSCEEETDTTPQYKQVTRQAKREHRKSLLLKTKNKAPPTSNQVQSTLPFENTQQDMFTMMGIKSKDEIRAEDTTSRTAREGHDSDISLQESQNPTTTSPDTTKTVEPLSHKGQNLKSCPQGTELNRSTEPSQQSMRRNLGDQLSLTPPTIDKTNHNSKPADTTETEILGDRSTDTLSQEGTDNSELHHSDTDNSSAGAYFNHEEKGWGNKIKTKKKNRKNTGKSNEKNPQTSLDSYHTGETSPGSYQNREAPKKYFLYF
jgi:hypothetical protein